MKLWKTVLTTTAVIATTAVAVKVVDKYLGKNILGRKWGRVVGKCIQDGNPILYVRSMNKLFCVAVSEETFNTVRSGQFYEVPTVCKCKSKNSNTEMYHKSDAFGELDLALQDICGDDSDIQYLEINLTSKTSQI